MKFKELLEAPQEVLPTQFGLDDRAENRKLATKLIRRVSETIEDNDDYKIYRTGDGYNGWIFLYNISEKTIDYIIQYKAHNWDWMKKTVTQYVLWRDDTSPYNKGVPERIFFGYLLQNYPSIMSDRLQTKDGHRFWIRRMADAIPRNYRVGIVHMINHTIDWFDPKNGSFQSWIDSKDMFGSEMKNQYFRYIISN